MRKNMTVHLADECAETLLYCTNDDCKQQIKRMDFDQHVEQQCEERAVQCPFAVPYGCPFDNLKAKELEGHIAENQLEHLSMKFDFFSTKVELQCAP